MKNLKCKVSNYFTRLFLLKMLNEYGHAHLIARLHGLYRFQSAPELRYAGSNLAQAGEIERRMGKTCIFLPLVPQLETGLIR